MQSFTDKLMLNNSRKDFSDRNKHIFENRKANTKYPHKWESFDCILVRKWS